MNKLYSEYNEPIVLFNYIEKKYEKINWETITPKELENILIEINVDFQPDTLEIWDVKERVEYLKNLLENKKLESETTPSLRTKKIISKIEALKKIYSSLHGKHHNSINIIIQESIDNLENELEKIRKSKILKIREEKERLEQKEFDENLESNKDNDFIKQIQEYPEQNDEDQEYEDQEYEDEDQEYEDEEYENEEYENDSQYNENKINNEVDTLEKENYNNKDSFSPKNQNVIHKHTTNKVIKNKQNFNKNIINNTLTSQKTNLENKWPPEDNDEIINKLTKKIDQLELMINHKDEVKKSGNTIDNKNEFSFDNKNKEFTSSNSMDEFNNPNNTEISFDGNDGFETFSKNNNSEMDFGKDNNDFKLNSELDNNSIDQTKTINELMKRISTLESSEDKTNENKELKKELELIKKHITKLELNKKEPKEKTRYMSSKINNKPRIIKTIQKIYKQNPQVNEKRKIHNSNITNVIKQSKLSDYEKEKLKKEILSNIPNNNKKNNVKTNSGTTLTPIQMENLLLELSQKFTLNQSNGNGQNVFNMPEVSTDPFAAMGNNQADPFAAMGNNQADPFAGIGNNQADPFAGIGNNQTNAFSGIGNNPSDPFAGMGNNQTNAFSGMGNNQSDPFDNIGKNNSSVNVSELQKQIKELQKIVLGKNKKPNGEKKQRKTITESKPKNKHYPKKEELMFDTKLEKQISFSYEKKPEKPEDFSNEKKPADKENSKSKIINIFKKKNQHKKGGGK